MSGMITENETAGQAVGRMLREMAAGSLAAGFTASLFAPLECVKTRLQVQDDPRFQRTGPKYTGA